MNSINVMIFTALVIMIILAVIILVKLQINSNANKDAQAMEQRLREEMSRLRQDTLDGVHSGISNLGKVISQNQQEAAARQSARLAELNMQFSETMNQVSQSLGEMHSLAEGVTDLKKVLSNVKTRGILGELQLASILEQILAPEQYEENVAVTGSSERVEFAVKFPGEGSRNVYLPIDSKFPGDAYLNLLDAYEIGDRDVIRQASMALKNAVLKAARDIRDKYIYPPHTTDFGIMFLPFEGLYAEVLRLGIIERLQTEYHVNIAGPTTMAAMLNSFQMGFRTMALQQSSVEVWDTLAKARTEFDKFQDALEKTQKRMELTQKDLEELVGVRTRAIQKALSKVDEI